jgi:UDP-glucose 4-epimerase
MSFTNSFIGSNIIVVGGAGFVGSNLIARLLSTNPKKLTIVDNLLSADISNVPLCDTVQFLFGSITDEKVLSALPVEADYVFHLACYHGNQSSIADPFADHQNNTLPSLSLFDRIKEFKNLKKVVYAAAACAVAEKTYQAPTATTEDQPVSLFHDSPYSISKIIGELYGNYYFQRYQLPFVKARFSNVYGPREILGAGQWRGTPHTVWRNVIPTFIWKALQRESLPLDNGGQTSRDFIFVDDLVEGLLACAANGNPGEVYNLATGKETTILDLAQLINRFTENPAPVELKPARHWDRSGKRYASTQKAAEKLGFVAQVEIEDGIRRTIDWTRESYDLIAHNIQRHQKMLRQSEIVLCKSSQT